MTNESKRTPAWAVFAGLAGVLLIGLLLALLLSEGGFFRGLLPEDVGRPAKKEVATADTTSGSLASVRRRIEEGVLLYEETVEVPLGQDIRRIDYALTRVMAGRGMGPDRLRLESGEVRRRHGRDYMFQVLEVDPARGSKPFMAELEGALGRWAPEASLLQLNATSWEVSVFHVPTHLLRLLPGEEASVSGEPLRGEPVLAIVIDDLGESVSFAQRLAKLDVPVTFSIWPGSSHMEKVARLAHAADQDILVHQPMEPMNYPRVNPGPGAVLTNMPSERIRRVVAENLDRVPCALGFNNHMGSRFTQNGSAVAAALGGVRERKMFVLDSLTHPRSRIPHEAGKLGVPYLRRDIFLDVVRGENAIVRQLRKAEQVALVQGYAVAIGHPFPETLAALRRWSKERNGRVRVERLSLLVERHGGGKTY